MNTQVDKNLFLQKTPKRMTHPKQWIHELTERMHALRHDWARFIYLMENRGQCLLRPPLPDFSIDASHVDIVSVLRHQRLMLTHVIGTVLAHQETSTFSGVIIEETEPDFLEQVQRRRGQDSRMVIQIFLP